MRALYYLLFSWVAMSRLPARRLINMWGAGRREHTYAGLQCPADAFRYILSVRRVECTTMNAAFGFMNDDR